MISENGFMTSRQWQDENSSEMFLFSPLQNRYRHVDNSKTQKKSISFNSKKPILIACLRKHNSVPGPSDKPRVSIIRDSYTRL